MVIHEESLVKTRNPLDLKIEPNNLKKYTYFYEKMIKIKPDNYQSKF